jgi:hypothetical protein
MTLRLNGSTSGYTEIDAPAVAGSNTLVLPSGNGTADQALVTNGSGTLSFADRGRMVLATAQSSTSGTSIDFTGIPSWVKRVTVMFNGVSTNGTSIIQVQIGSGSFITSGYASQYSTNGLSGSLTSGFVTSYRADTTNAIRGHMAVCLVSSNTYTVSSILGGSGVSNDITSASGALSLSGTLDRIRITTVNGTDTFDAGSINILMEG